MCPQQTQKDDIKPHEKSLKIIPQGQSESVNQRSGNTMVKKKDKKI